MHCITRGLEVKETMICEVCDMRWIQELSLRISSLLQLDIMAVEEDGVCMLSLMIAKFRSRDFINALLIINTLAPWRASTR